MIPGRDRVALQTDIANAEIHIPPGNGVGCFRCGISTVLVNPNVTVTYEGKLILLQGTVFSPHTSPGINNSGRVGCGTSHNTVALPLSDPTKPRTPNDGLILINNLLPIHVGDILTCGARIIGV